ncbi:hypothetical protein [Microcoleus anatoxicus]|uniref:hypothetical protein n=1 Tax=Microcoleus anatoxicus TaxID=2705319 RepID=UPI0030C98F4F
MLWVRSSENSSNSPNVCRHSNSRSQFVNFSHSTLGHKETGLVTKHHAWGDLPTTSSVDRC